MFQNRYKLDFNTIFNDPHANGIGPSNLLHQLMVRLDWNHEEVVPVFPPNATVAQSSI
jgi:hypothetical protein